MRKAEQTGRPDGPDTRAGATSATTPHGVLGALLPAGNRAVAGVLASVQRHPGSAAHAHPHVPLSRRAAFLRSFEGQALGELRRALDDAEQRVRGEAASYGVQLGDTPVPSPIFQTAQVVSLRIAVMRLRLAENNVAMAEAARSRTPDTMQAPRRRPDHVVDQARANLERTRREVLAEHPVLAGAEDLVTPDRSESQLRSALGFRLAETWGHIDVARRLATAPRTWQVPDIVDRTAARLRVAAGTVERMWLDERVAEAERERRDAEFARGVAQALALLLAVGAVVSGGTLAPAALAVGSTVAGVGGAAVDLRDRAFRASLARTSPDRTRAILAGAHAPESLAWLAAEIGLAVADVATAVAACRRVVRLVRAVRVAQGREMVAAALRDLAAGGDSVRRGLGAELERLAREDPHALGLRYPDEPLPGESPAEWYERTRSPRSESLAEMPAPARNLQIESAADQMRKASLRAGLAAGDGRWAHYLTHGGYEEIMRSQRLIGGSGQEGLGQGLGVRAMPVAPGMSTPTSTLLEFTVPDRAAAAAGQVTNFHYMGTGVMWHATDRASITLGIRVHRVRYTNGAVAERVGDNWVLRLGEARRELTLDQLLRLGERPRP